MTECKDDVNAHALLSKKIDDQSRFTLHARGGLLFSCACQHVLFADITSWSIA